MPKWKEKRRRHRRLPPLPPKTMRYCVRCRRVTKFKYNTGIFHSECIQYGCRHARDPERKEE